MTIGVVVPCYRQERFLSRTLTAIERSLASADWKGVLVISARSGDPLPALSPRWTLIEAEGGHPTTPGASRMLGFAVCGGEWVLFADADFEVDAAWVAEALEVVARRPELGGVWGRVEEWFVDERGEHPGSRDMFGVGQDERTVNYVTTPALYRREALATVGGYDARLNSEEDFELGLRFGARSFALVSLGRLAGRHWSAPRPSFGEITRRWRSGLCFGQGQVLRLYARRPEFFVLLRRQTLYLGALATGALGLVAAAASLATSSLRPLAWWSVLPLGVLLLMSLRKRSVRLALHSLMSWTALGLGLVVGWFRLPPGEHAPLGRGGGGC